MRTSARAHPHRASPIHVHSGRQPGGDSHLKKCTWLKRRRRAITMRWIWLVPSIWVVNKSRTQVASDPRRGVRTGTQLTHGTWIDVDWRGPAWPVIRGGRPEERGAGTRRGLDRQRSSALLGAGTDVGQAAFNDVRAHAPPVVADAERDRVSGAEHHLDPRGFGVAARVGQRFTEHSQQVWGDVGTVERTNRSLEPDVDAGQMSPTRAPCCSRLLDGGSLAPGSTSTPRSQRSPMRLMALDNVVLLPRLAAAPSRPVPRWSS
jgi:hypothetical protein